MATLFVPPSPTIPRETERPHPLRETINDEISGARTAIQSGHPVLIIDDCASVSASALVTAASVVTNEAVNLISRISGGLIQVAISARRASQFMLHPQRSRHELPAGQPPSAYSKEDWLVSVEARLGVGSGISIADRRTTIRILGSEHPQPGDIARPGHIFPCRCHPGGVVARAAIPEAALDLVVGFGMPDAAVFSYLLGSDGEISSPAEAQSFATSQDIPSIKLSSLISWRLQHEPLVEQVACSELPTHLGNITKIHIFRSLVDNSEQVALVHGVIRPEEPTLVRVHIEDPLNDLIGLHSPHRSRGRLDAALHQIGGASSGVLVYLRPPLGRNALSERLSQPDSSAHPTSRPSTMMEFGVGARILRALGVEAVTILCRTPRSYDILELFGLRVVGYQELLS